MSRQSVEYNCPDGGAQEPATLNDYDESPTWQERQETESESPSSMNNADETRKMTAFIEDSLLQ